MGLIRAVHQLVDDPRVLEDPVAIRIVGADRAAAFRGRSRWRDRLSLIRRFRARIVVRSRVAEDELAAAVAAGVRQYVVLGAGLDTFAYRNPFPGVRVFEVDHPATQAWKRELLTATGIEVPASLTFAAADFERDRLRDVLTVVGFAADEPAWFSWLGVTYYLEPETVLAMLRDIRDLVGPAGGLVFDYARPTSALSMPARALVSIVTMTNGGAHPFKCRFEPAVLARHLSGAGFARVADLDARDLNVRYFQHRRDGLRVDSLARVIVARP